ncbi:hypothetical protein PAEAM_56360 [Paenibacillus sp. GM1FR]|uniref:hypothetical protein n=1 Tax=Paenibacillus sp. GM1FR TaxID=2059267 RepID=UPI000C26F0A9|nr:hypothetical protein [Paenibacillus sp. GM1FR]PJN48774.1 hypothetical protein PAEAM_56360 [Paenibacillus sp. GM1FR]
MQPELREVSENEEFDFIELVDGETRDFSVKKLYEVKVDHDGSIFGVEGERYLNDDQYIPNTEMFYNPNLKLKYFKKVRE